MSLKCCLHFCLSSYLMVRIGHSFPDWTFVSSNTILWTVLRYFWRDLVDPPLQCRIDPQVLQIASSLVLWHMKCDNRWSLVLKVDFWSLFFFMPCLMFFNEGCFTFLLSSSGACDSSWLTIHDIATISCAALAWAHNSALGGDQDQS